MRYFIGLLIFWGYIITLNVQAQCTNTISSFPYFENFENGQAGFTTGGNNSSWAFGTPNKNIITGAASGTKCFITGGLSNSSYNNAESSWLMSPCFNFSTLINPQISFSIFWETERRFDGASFQYSTDGGNVWQTLGNINSNSSCLGENWFNFSPITGLGIDGWSGTALPTVGNCLGTGGSDGWVTARHSIQMLAGQSNVRFRFIFGAGTACNNFNGFAVDNFLITDITTNTGDFLYTCLPNKQVQFYAVASGCISGYSWNFGDASSPANTSSAQNPQHTFSTPNTYTITLTITYTTGGTVTKTKDINIIDVNITEVASIKCHGNAGGGLRATITGGSNTYSYLWNTNPPQTTATASNLIAGNYTVTVSGNNNVCTISANTTLTQPAALTGVVNVTNELCQQQNGKIETIINGGVLPYTYLWSNGATNNSLQNLVANQYNVAIRDANNCPLSLSAIVKDSVNNLVLNLGNDTSFCPGNRLILRAGQFQRYVWQNFSTRDSFVVTRTGKYYVKATDADGCTVSDTINVNVDCSDIFFPSAFSPNKDGLNDLFGAIGNVRGVTSFNFAVYGRWGQVIFTSTNPFTKWDGKQNGTDMDLGIYVWVATYSINNQPPKTRKGTVMIIR